MSVYVDDILHILLAGEEEAVQGAMRALSRPWAMSSVELGGSQQTAQVLWF